MDGYNAEKSPLKSEPEKEESNLTNTKLNSDSSFDSKYQTLEELAEEEDTKMGWCADFTNVKDGASTISCPKRYRTITVIAPALRRNGLKNVKVHSNVRSIKMDTASGYFFIVDPDNQKYCSVDGVLYSKDKRILYSIPQDAASFNIPDSVEVIGPYALYFSSLASIIIPSSVHVICKNAFAYSKKLKSIYIPNTVLKIAENAFEGNKKMIIETAFLEKPISWDFDLSNVKEIKWGIRGQK